MATTGTTIQKEIERLTKAKSDIKTAIINKGGVVSEYDNIDKYAAAIDKISVGGGSTTDVTVLTINTDYSENNLQIVVGWETYGTNQVYLSMAYVDNCPERINIFRNTTDVNGKSYVFMGGESFKNQNFNFIITVYYLESSDSAYDYLLDSKTMVSSWITDNETGLNLVDGKDELDLAKKILIIAEEQN